MSIHVEVAEEKMHEIWNSRFSYKSPPTRTTFSPSLLFLLPHVTSSPPHCLCCEVTLPLATQQHTESPPGATLRAPRRAPTTTWVSSVPVRSRGPSPQQQRLRFCSAEHPLPSCSHGATSTAAVFQNFQLQAGQTPLRPWLPFLSHFVLPFPTAGNSKGGSRCATAPFEQLSPFLPPMPPWSFYGERNFIEVRGLQTSPRRTKSRPGPAFLWPER